jgi:hypothetical protein
MKFARTQRRWRRFSDPRGVRVAVRLSASAPAHLPWIWSFDSSDGFVKIVPDADEKQPVPTGRVRKRKSRASGARRSLVQSSRAATRRIEHQIDGRPTAQPSISQLSFAAIDSINETS